MDDIHRITEKGYEPSHNDVTRMRSRTIRGVQEHHFVVENGGCHVLVGRVPFRLPTVVTLSRARGRVRMDCLRHRLLKYPRAYAITFDYDIRHDRNSEPHGCHTSWMRTRSFSMHQYPHSISTSKNVHASIVCKIVLRSGL